MTASTRPALSTELGLLFSVVVATTTSSRASLHFDLHHLRLSPLSPHPPAPPQRRCRPRHRRRLLIRYPRFGCHVETRQFVVDELGDNQPGPAAVEVVELPRPRPKEAGGAEQASVHAIAEEKRPKAKTAQAKPRGGMAKDEVTGPGDMAALQRQVEELTGQVRELKVQRVSTNREIKLQRAWVEGEMEERAMAAQVQQAEERMGALEAGLAAQVQRAEESRSQTESQRLWVEGKWEGLWTQQLQRVEHTSTGWVQPWTLQIMAEQMLDLDLQLQLVDERMVAQMVDLEASMAVGDSGRGKRGGKGRRAR